MKTYKCKANIQQRQMQRITIYATYKSVLSEVRNLSAEA
jgi:hypothetical protein